MLALCLRAVLHVSELVLNYRKTESILISVCAFYSFFLVYFVQQICHRSICSVLESCPFKDSNFKLEDSRLVENAEHWLPETNAKVKMSTSFDSPLAPRLDAVGQLLWRMVAASALTRSP